MDESTHDHSEANIPGFSGSSFVICTNGTDRGTNDPRKVLLGAGMQYVFGPDKQTVRHIRKPFVRD